MLERHEIPTHLAVQDRFFYGLTMAQLALVLLGGSAAWALWSDGRFLPDGPRAGAALTTMAVTLAVALVRPAGRGLTLWALVLLRFATTPKRSVWRPVPAASAATVSDDARWVSFSPGLGWAVEGGMP